MKDAPVRFRDGGSLLHQWAAPEVLVTCPRCGSRAGVAVPERRLTCGHCGLARESADDEAWGGPVDPYFGLPLWLQADFRGHAVWAYNDRHLRRLRDFVAAGQRERGNTLPHPGGPRSVSMSMIEKLPAWMKAAKNRERLLVVLDRLAGSQ